MTVNVKARALRDRLAKGEFILAPGIYDGISARVANQMGFPALYMTGYGATASMLGLPDAGLATYSDMVGRAEMICSVIDVPLIAAKLQTLGLVLPKAVRPPPGIVLPFRLVRVRT